MAMLLAYVLRMSLAMNWESREGSAARVSSLKGTHVRSLGLPTSTMHGYAMVEAIVAAGHRAY